MHPFTLERPRDLSAALALRAQSGRNDIAAEYIAGGTDMVQLLQENVRRPDRLVSIGGLTDKRIDVSPRGCGSAPARRWPRWPRTAGVAAQFPVIAQALLESASPQVRNQATIGGNLLQRTRCPYFRDTGYSACNKRIPGSGCSALRGENRWHAVLGGSDDCIAVHPSDLAVALVALDAAVHIQGSRGERSVALREFHRLPGSTPHIEAELRPAEVIAAITVPAHPGRTAIALPEGSRPRLVRIRRRLRRRRARDARRWPHPPGPRSGGRRGHEALASSQRRDGVGRLLVATRRAAQGGGTVAAQGAQGRGHNDFKIELMQRAIVRAAEAAGARA